MRKFYYCDYLTQLVKRQTPRPVAFLSPPMAFLSPPIKARKSLQDAGFRTVESHDSGVMARFWSLPMRWGIGRSAWGAGSMGRSPWEDRERLRCGEALPGGRVPHHTRADLSSKYSGVVCCIRTLNGRLRHWFAYRIPCRPAHAKLLPGLVSHLLMAS